jgi:DNA-binding transcriptional ArsR family regulator
MAAKEMCIPMLKALADPTRWSIVGELLHSSRTIGELTHRLKVSQYNISKHIRILREAGIIETHREGRSVKCSVGPRLHKTLSRNKPELDLGCCKFHFETLPKAAAK